MGTGSSNADGVSRGPPVEGPRLVDGQFVQAPPYLLSYTDGAVSVNTTISAWGPGLVHPLYLAPSLPDISFSSVGITLSAPGESVAASFNASARISIPAGAQGQTVSVAARVDARKKE